MSRYTYEESVPDDVEYYRNRRARGYEGSEAGNTAPRTRGSSRTFTSYSDDQYSYYTGYTDYTADSRITYKNVDAPRDEVFIPAALLPQLTSKRDIQIAQPHDPPSQPLPPHKAPRVKLEDCWQPNLNIMGSDAEPVVLEGFRKIAAKAVVKYRQEEDIAGRIKYEMDKTFGRPWCCIYGAHFDSFVTHDGGMFIYFKLENKFGLLWRNRYE